MNYVSKYYRLKTAACVHAESWTIPVVVLHDLVDGAYRTVAAEDAASMLATGEWEAVYANAAAQAPTNVAA